MNSLTFDPYCNRSQPALFLRGCLLYRPAPDHSDPIVMLPSHEPPARGVMWKQPPAS